MNYIRITPTRDKERLSSSEPEWTGWIEGASGRNLKFYQCCGTQKLYGASSHQVCLRVMAGG
jgi:hypothetical protein